ncbi:GNAT family N-acetyltransferase [Clostridium sp. Marseille-Q7071]
MINRIYMQKFVSDKDFEDYFSLVANAKVMAMVTERAIPLEEARNDFKLLLCKNEKHEEFGIFKVLERATNNFIGLGKLEINENDFSEAELGYLLLPEFWGKGYGSEIAEILLNKAEESKLLHRIIAIIDPKNVASKKILLKNNFISEKICEIDGLPGEILSRTM